VVVATAVLILVATAAYVEVVASTARPSAAVAQQERTLSAPGEPCTDPLLPAAVLKVEEGAQFLGLSGGLCYSFVGESNSTAGGAGASTTYTFDYYNGSVVYPCGDLPQEAAASQIQVLAIANGSGATVQTARLDGDASSLNAPTDCGPNPVPVSVVSAGLVEVTIPAVLEVNLTLDARSVEAPVTSLSAVISFPGDNQTVEFAGVSGANPLAPQRSISQTTIITGGRGPVVGGVYDAVIDGRFQGGATFEFAVRIALVNG
jgi:hypothetical protein